MSPLPFPARHTLLHNAWRMLVQTKHTLGQLLSVHVLPTLSVVSKFAVMAAQHLTVAKQRTAVSCEVAYKCEL